MELPSTLAWLVDAAGASPGADRLLAELGTRLVADGMPLAGGALTLAVPHPIIAHRTWLWRADTGAVIEALGFAAGGAAGRPAGPPGGADRSWLAGLGAGRVHEDIVGSGGGPSGDGPTLGWVGSRPFTSDEADQLRSAARFAAAPLAALAARATLSAVLEAYLGRRSAARVLAGPLRRDVGETIHAALLCADLRGFTALSEAGPATAVIAALDAWFDRIAGAVHAFGGEVLKFIGDGVLAIFPLGFSSREEAAEIALAAAKETLERIAGINRDRTAAQRSELRIGIGLHIGEVILGNVGAADRLDFTAIGPAVNLACRLETLTKRLWRPLLVSEAFAKAAFCQLVSLGFHPVKGMSEPEEVFGLPGGDGYDI
jgi:adenylate cyclase